MGKVFGVRVKPRRRRADGWRALPGLPSCPGDDRIAVFLVQADDAARGAAARELARPPAHPVRRLRRPAPSRPFPGCRTARIDYRLLEAQLR